MSYAARRHLPFAAGPLCGGRMPFWRYRVVSWIAAMLRHEFDLGPAVSRWESRLRRPSVVLSILLVAGSLLAVFTNPAAIVAPVSLLVVLVVGCVWPMVAVRGVTATLRFRHRRGVEGESSTAVVHVRNVWPWPVWGISVEGDIGGRAGMAIPCVPPRSTTEFSWECIPGCRGEWPRGTVELTTGFPFGLISARRPVAVERSLLVWPITMPLPGLLEAAETSAGDAHFSGRRAGDSGDVIATRPFRQGDPLRRVHWALTARTGALVACDRQAPVSTSVHVAVDVDRLAHGRAASSPALDAAIRVAATICQAYHRRNATVECSLGTKRLTLALGQPGIVAFFDALARYSPAGDESPAVTSASRPPSGRFPIVITTSDGANAAGVVMTPRDDGLVIVVEANDSASRPPESVRQDVRRLHVGCQRAGLADVGLHWERIRRAS